MDRHSCLLPFDTDDPEFVRGFECGRVWAMLRIDTDAFDAIAHDANIEMVMRMAEATGRVAAGEELGDGWINVSFAAAEETGG